MSAWGILITAIVILFSIAFGYYLGAIRNQNINDQNTTE